MILRIVIGLPIILGIIFCITLVGWTFNRKNQYLGEDHPFFNEINFVTGLISFLFVLFIIVVSFLVGMAILGEPK